MTQPEIKTIKISKAQEIALNFLSDEKAKLIAEHERIKAAVMEIESNIQVVTMEAIVGANLEPEKVVVTTLKDGEVSYFEKDAVNENGDDSFK